MNFCIWQQAMSHHHFLWQSCLCHCMKHFWHMPDHKMLITDKSFWQFIIILQWSTSPKAFFLLFLNYVRPLHFLSDYILLSFCIYTVLAGCCCASQDISQLLQSEQVQQHPLANTLYTFAFCFSKCYMIFFFTTLWYCKSAKINESGSLVGLNTSSLVTSLTVCQICFNSLFSGFMCTAICISHVDVD